MQPSSVIALGFFDGVHLGHMALLRTVRQRADALGLPAVALSFDTHPDALVRRGFDWSDISAGLRRYGAELEAMEEE